MNIGIIAEDESDVAVLRGITLTLLRPNKTNIGFKKCVGRGGGAVRKKCGMYAVNLVQRGCAFVMAIHDLDDHDEKELRELIQAKIGDAKAKLTVVLIPRREIESWLMYDAVAIARAFNERKLLHLPPDPENIKNPKEHLQRLIWKHYRKHYVNTLHNGKIAEKIRVASLAKAQSFAPHPWFVAQVVAHMKR